ncbi:uncharacterized protein LOC114303588 [Camellia sinensis]|uniref:uncharacterized protein LOC114303588 n=1 Tax=Camellia sinensis TaxID=4442 RepID=UPI0010361A40|nr:uncharacterized protein LOC114303588 [Camellia sinensis]
MRDVKRRKRDKCRDPHSSGKITLNTDGCPCGDPGKGGFGGVFCDEERVWLYGFFGKLENCYSLEVEMWGIYCGLTFVLGKGLRKVIIETNLTMAEELLTKGPPLNCPYQSIIEDSRHLIQWCNCTIQHIMWETKKYVDKLANMGAAQSKVVVVVVVVEEPPVKVRSQILVDMVGVEYRRI